MVKILFVCSGNICRSPTAEGVFQKFVSDRALSALISVDSAGIGNWHVNKPPDHRSQFAALARGIDLSKQKARQFKYEDFDFFDYILAMDQSHLDYLKLHCPADCKLHMKLFLDYVPSIELTEIPDPYYGDPNGFEVVLDLVEAASKGLMEHIINTYSLG
ncbi:MAG: low molecular weight protein-tyrosine-phosphatase [Pseudomonadota bacterium]|nr:low molecular weight protein-tyrosine-phosphatase [Pseudomonadota bacterium]